MSESNNAIAAWPGVRRGNINADVAVPQLSPLSTAGWPMWAGAVSGRLEQLLGLPHNWDGRGSGRVFPDTALFAFALLARTMSPNGRAPSIGSLGNGGLQLEWHLPSADIEVEVTKPNRVSVWCVDRASGIEREFDMTTDFHELGNLLSNTTLD